MDEAVSLVSCHLRNLAEHGLVEEAEARSAEAPEKAAAHLAASRMFLEQSVERYRGTSTSAPTGGPSGTRRYDEQRAREAAGETEGREHVALHVYGFPFRV